MNQVHPLIIAHNLDKCDDLAFIFYAILISQCPSESRMPKVIDTEISWLMYDRSVTKCQPTLQSRKTCQTRQVLRR
jgi:hypothetical protein